MEQRGLLLSALGVGVGMGVGLGLASGQSVGKWVGSNPESGVVTADQIEQELLRMVVDGRDSKVTFDEFPYYIRAPDVNDSLASFTNIPDFIWLHYQLPVPVRAPRSEPGSAVRTPRSAPTTTHIIRQIGTHHNPNTKIIRPQIRNKPPDPDPHQVQIRTKPPEPHQVQIRTKPPDPDPTPDPDPHQASGHPYPNPDTYPHQHATPRSHPRSRSAPSHQTRHLSSPITSHRSFTRRPTDPHQATNCHHPQPSSGV